MGSLLCRYGSQVPRGLARTLALRKCRQALQVKADRQAQLIPAGQLGVKLTDSGARLRQELLLMKRLAHKSCAKLLQRFLVRAVVNLPDAALNLEKLLSRGVEGHPISPAHCLEDSYQVMPQKASLSSGCCNGLFRDSCAAVGSFCETPSAPPSSLGREAGGDAGARFSAQGLAAIRASLGRTSQQAGD